MFLPPVYHASKSSTTTALVYQSYTRGTYFLKLFHEQNKGALRVGWHTKKKSTCSTLQVNYLTIVHNYILTVQTSSNNVGFIIIIIMIIIITIMCSLGSGSLCCYT